MAVKGTAFSCFSGTHYGTNALRLFRGNLSMRVRGSFGKIVAGRKKDLRYNSWPALSQGKTSLTIKNFI